MSDDITVKSRVTQEPGPSSPLEVLLECQFSSEDYQILDTGRGLHKAHHNFWKERTIGTTLCMDHFYLQTVIVTEGAVLSVRYGGILATQVTLDATSELKTFLKSSIRSLYQVRQ